MRYQVELTKQLADNNQEWYEVREYTRGRLASCAVLNTLESATNRLALAIELGKLDGINATNRGELASVVIGGFGHE
jgi:hypothetical protein